MKSRYSQKVEIFERTKKKYGEFMEDYGSRKSKDHSQTDFDELESIRNNSRKENFRYQFIFRIMTGIGVILFIYFFLSLAGQDISAIFN
jgi:hypothetical protein